MIKKRSVCIVTGSRAEYGILKPLIKKIITNKKIKLHVVVTGAHLSKNHGLTYKEIIQDNVKIDKKLDIGIKFDSEILIGKSIATAITKISKTLKNIKPDIVCLCGDRYEILASAIACTIMRVPIAHIHGGEVTFGAYDESFRHAITKMSHLHFTATEEYKNRVIQLGENKKNIYNFGSLVIDSIESLKLLNKNELEKKFKIKFKSKNILITYHPVTLEKDYGLSVFNNLLSIISKLKNTNIIFTKANADSNGIRINKMIDKFTSNNKENSISFDSLGSLNFMSLMKHVDLMIGNSSSGIIEAPHFNLYTINIGDRQNGRVKASSIIDCSGTKASIFKAISKGYKIKSRTNKVFSPYYKKNTAKKIVDILENVSLKNILYKEFKDYN
jgi:GDP/UDP-N,N'-diacetylbacillosamine 2-epimerase (hydrolysing)